MAKDDPVIISMQPGQPQTTRTYPDDSYGTGAPITREDIDACRNAIDRIGNVREFACRHHQVAAITDDGVVELATCKDTETALNLASLLNNYQALLQRIRIPIGPHSSTPHGDSGADGGSDGT